MPLISADYKWFHSLNKRGGAIQTGSEYTGTKHDLFDAFEPAETTAGDVYYACVFFQNKNTTTTMEGVKIYLDSNTPSGTTSVRIALSANGVNAAAEVIADELTAPAPALTFVTADGEINGLSVPDLAPDDYIGVWFEFTLNAATAAMANDGWTTGVYAKYV